MIKISKRIIECAGRDYGDCFFWLREASLDLSDREHPSCYGRFEVSPRTYTREAQEYLGCPEAIGCIEQLGYSTLAGLIQEGVIGCRISLDDFLNLPQKSMLLRGIKQLLFKRAIRKANFNGKITLDSYKLGEPTIFVVKYDFMDKSFFGESEFLVYGLE